MNQPTPLTLDVRDILRSGGEPFSEIMHAVTSLAPGQALRLLATFKPAPLFGVMAQRGYAHVEHEIGGGDWEVLFTPASGASAPGPASASSDKSSAWPLPGKTLDNRGLTPPEPLARTLEALGDVAPGAVVEVLTDREPLFLYNELKARGHEYRPETRGAEGYRILIRCGGPGGATA